MNVERHEIVYRGNVQGVGFRYTACRIAASFLVVGYVRNQPDGSVLLVTEGTKLEIDKFLGQLAKTMDRNIQSVEVRQTQAVGEFSGFEIRH